MASRFSLVKNTTVTTISAASMELIGSTSGPRTRLMEMHIFLRAATASVYALGRPAAIGVTPTSPVTLLAEDTGDGSPGAKVAVAWGTGPTAPTNFLRQVALPAAIAAGIIWTFGADGITIPTSGSLVLWNITANSANTDVVLVVEE